VQDRRKTSQPTGIIILRLAGKNEWVFNLPRITQGVDDRLEEGIDQMDADPQRAALIFRQLVEEYPEHMDAYHHLGLALEQMGRNDEAFQARKQAVDMALKFFPTRFSTDRDRLDWGFVENRPFLRLYHSYGLQLQNHGQIEEALGIFENLLGLSPNDNLGTRALVVGCHFELKEPEGVLSVCRQFPNDAMEHLLYGKALAFFQLGKQKKAGEALDIAVKCYPRIAAELSKTKHRKPKGMHEGRITLGGPDQAYVYWQDHGKYWANTPGAIDFLKQKTPGKLPGQE
jgi:tetratricopeptide (TPR) repeat protein